MMINLMILSNDDQSVFVAVTRSHAAVRMLTFLLLLLLCFCHTGVLTAAAAAIVSVFLCTMLVMLSPLAGP
jgi:hypothetical protein